LRKIYKGVDDMYAVTLENGLELWCTMDHRILAPHGWIRLGQVDVGSVVYSVPNDGRVTSAVASIRHLGKMDVWDIEVEEDHSYVAHGFVNHNSSRPNAQEIPRDSLVKKLYTRRFGPLGIIWQTDLSQIELRLLAALCGDPTMVQAYRDGVDLHSLTTSRVFDIPYEHFEKSYMAWLQEHGKAAEAKELDRKRKIGKTSNFLTGYGGGGGDSTAGGKALKFYTTVLMDIRRIAQIKMGEEIVGGRVRV
jgi:hypothetical protein